MQSSLCSMKTSVEISGSPVMQGSRERPSVSPDFQNRPDGNRGEYLYGRYWFLNNALCCSGYADEQGHANRFIEHNAFSEQAMTTGHIAMVRCEDDDSIICQSSLFQRFQYAAKRGVQLRDFPKVPLPKFFNAVVRIPSPVLEPRRRGPYWEDHPVRIYHIAACRPSGGNMEGGALDTILP